MHSSLAAWRAAASDRDAMARTSTQALFCIAGITLRVPIFAVPKIPQTTFFMRGSILPRMTAKLLLSMIILIAVSPVHAAAHQPRLPIQDGQVIPLWQGPAPGALGTQDSGIPAIAAFLPRTMAASTPAVIVCPGGGYVSLASNHEGRQVASYLN